MHRWLFPLLTCGLAVSVFLSVASGYRPSGWQWQDSAEWQYNFEDEAWYFFFNKNPDTIQKYRRQGFSGVTTNPPLGWVYFQWPYAYSYDQGDWYQILDDQHPVVENISTKEQSTYGVESARFVRIPGGTFSMEDRETTVSSFLLAQEEVTKEWWNRVVAEAENLPANQQYDFDPVITCGSSYPVVAVTWYDAVKWANAASETEGLEPVYYTDETQTEVYRSGQRDIGPGAVDTSANGYRLPTEAEWALAARGGPSGGEFSYAGSDTPGDVAYYQGNSDGSETDPARCPDQAEVPAVDRALPLTGLGYSIWPVGQLEPNGIATYDMSGNAAEWVFDYNGSLGFAPVTNPLGPDTGSERVVRGGSFNGSTAAIEVTARSAADPGLLTASVESRKTPYGFRVARNAPSDD